MSGAGKHLSSFWRFKSRLKCEGEDFRGLSLSNDATYQQKRDPEKKKIPELIDIHFRPRHWSHLPGAGECRRVEGSNRIE